MKFLAVLLASIAMPAYAHTGHVGELAGHGHWIGVGALAAAALAAWFALTRKRTAKADMCDAPPESEEAEA